MNKVFIGLILAVCVLGMALVMLNDRLGRKPDQRSAPPAAETVQPSRTPEEIAATARAMELAEAALAPPPERDRVQDVEDEAGQTGAVGQSATSESSKPPIKSDSLPKPEPVAKPEPVPPPAHNLAEAQKPEPRHEVAAKPEAKAEIKPKSESKPERATAAKDAKGGKDARDAKDGGKTATKFVIFSRDKGATVRVAGNGKLEYSSMTLENPDRVVVDLTGDWKFPPNPGVPKNDMVSAVRVGQNGDKTRLVIDLKGKPRKVVLVQHKGGDGVDVRVDK